MHEKALKCNTMYDIVLHIEKGDRMNRVILIINQSTRYSIKKNDAHVIIDALNDTIKLWNYYNKNKDFQEQINDYINYYI